MSEEEIKYTIKKELRKLYGEKASRYFKKNILEIIKQNLILARKEIIKFETGEEPDDLFSREFFQKYEKRPWICWEDISRLPTDLSRILLNPDWILKAGLKAHGYWRKRLFFNHNA